MPHRPSPGPQWAAFKEPPPSSPTVPSEDEFNGDQLKSPLVTPRKRKAGNIVASASALKAPKFPRLSGSRQAGASNTGDVHDRTKDDLGPPSTLLARFRTLSSVDRGNATQNATAGSSKLPSQSKQTPDNGSARTHNSSTVDTKAAKHTTGKEWQRSTNLPSAKLGMSESRVTSGVSKLARFGVGKGDGKANGIESTSRAHAFERESESYSGLKPARPHLIPPPTQGKGKILRGQKPNPPEVIEISDDEPPPPPPPAASSSRKTVQKSRRPSQNDIIELSDDDKPPPNIASPPKPHSTSAPLRKKVSMSMSRPVPQIRHSVPTLQSSSRTRETATGIIEIDFSDDDPLPSLPFRNQSPLVDEPIRASSAPESREMPSDREIEPTIGQPASGSGNGRQAEGDFDKDVHMRDPSPEIPPAAEPEMPSTAFGSRDEHQGNSSVNIDDGIMRGLSPGLPAISFDDEKNNDIPGNESASGVDLPQHLSKPALAPDTDVDKLVTSTINPSPPVPPEDSTEVLSSKLSERIVEQSIDEPSLVPPVEDNSPAARQGSAQVDVAVGNNTIDTSSLSATIDASEAPVDRQLKRMEKSEGSGPLLVLEPLPPPRADFLFKRIHDRTQLPTAEPDLRGLGAALGVDKLPAPKKRGRRPSDSTRSSRHTGSSPLPSSQTSTRSTLPRPPSSSGRLAISRSGQSLADAIIQAGRQNTKTNFASPPRTRRASSSRQDVIDLSIEDEDELNINTPISDLATSSISTSLVRSPDKQSRTRNEASASDKDAEAKPSSPKRLERAATDELTLCPPEDVNHSSAPSLTTQVSAMSITSPALPTFIPSESKPTLPQAPRGPSQVSLDETTPIPNQQKPKSLDAIRSILGRRLPSKSSRTGVSRPLFSSGGLLSSKPALGSDLSANAPDLISSERPSSGAVPPSRTMLTIPAPSDPSSISDEPDRHIHPKDGLILKEPSTSSPSGRIPTEIKQSVVVPAVNNSSDDHLRSGQLADSDPEAAAEEQECEDILEYIDWQPTVEQANGVKPTNGEAAGYMSEVHTEDDKALSGTSLPTGSRDVSSDKTRPSPMVVDMDPELDTEYDEILPNVQASASGGSSRSSLRRSSRKSSRSSSTDQMNDQVNGYLEDPPDTPYPSGLSSHSATPDRSRPSTSTRNFGGIPVITWSDYRQDITNFTQKYYQAKDLPHELQDHINAMDPFSRSLAGMRTVFEAAISENTAQDEPDAPPIKIINDLDDDPTPPWEFHYTNHMWHGEGVPAPDVSKLPSCDCIGKCDPKSKTCACLKRQQKFTSEYTPEFVYDHRGRLKRDNIPIFECNDLCGCGDECKNRVVQHGRKCVINIAKTETKGWGVFAGPKKIFKGTFIGIYAGELLTDEVGEQRGLKYNKFGRTYLFDIDFHHLKEGNKNWENKYVVDAYHAGNFTRFLNHSCDPNCQLNPCYINESDIDKPLLTVFAGRDIEPGEELCFSYSGPADDDDQSDDDNAPPSSPVSKMKNEAIYVPCRCGAANCTGVMFK